MAKVERDHTSTVPLSIYDAPRGARRRIGKELAELRERRKRAEAEVARLRATYRDPFSLQIAKSIEAAARIPSVPLRLLACADCHHPVAQCTCKDADGNPLDWGL